MKRLFTGNVFLAAMIIAVIFSCASIAYMVMAKPAASKGPVKPLGSEMTVIRAPTSTARPLPPTLTPVPPTPAATPTLAPGQFGAGVYVQPTTGGVGLRIHTDPKLNSDFFAAFDSEVFQITKGPAQADGYVWWYLTASYDSKRSGWAVQDYLITIPKP
jgi:hypothetical protein